MKTFIFDLDGTVVNTIDDIAYNINLMLGYYSFKQHKVEDVLKMVGNGARKLVERALPENARKDDFIDEALGVYQKYYDENLVVNSFVYDGMKEVLLKLKENGYALAVISNKDHRHVFEVVDKLLPEIFDVVKGYNGDFPHKPSPEVVLNVINTLGASKSDTYFVGDSKVDILTAENTGIKSVGVLWGFGGEKSFVECSPNFTISAPKQLLEL